MTKNTINKVVSSIQSGQRAISNLSAEDKNTLEKKWDVEHAYYSSSIEGSNIDRKEFDKLAKKVS